jgi:hypothetical protein
VACTAIANYPQHLTNEKKLAPSSIIIALAALRFFYKITQGLVLGRSYSDPQEGMSAFLLLANREVSVRAATAETPTITTVNSKKNFMISIFGSVSGFARFTLRVRARESLTGIHLLLSSQHSSRASPKRTYLPECPEKHSLLVI